MCLRGSSTPPLFLKNRSSCSNYRVGGLRLSVQTLCAHVCMCLNMANMCVCECLLNQNLQRWIYSGTFPGALRARNQKFPLIVVYSYAWIYTTSFARKYRASLLTKKKQKKNNFPALRMMRNTGRKKVTMCALLSFACISHFESIGSVWLMSSLESLSAPENLLLDIWETGCAGLFLHEST